MNRAITSLTPSTQASSVNDSESSAVASALLHEKRGQWRQAATAWARAIDAVHGQKAELFFHHGRALEHSGRWKEAEEAYRKALAQDTTEAHWHFRLGAVLERMGRWEEAVEAYEAALAREEGDASECLYRLGWVLSHLGRQKEAIEAFRWVHLPRGPGGLGAPPSAAQMLETAEDYLIGLEQLPLRDRCILYECHQGAYVGCNPYAIFRYVLKHPDFRGWTHVWVLNDKSRLPDWLRARRDVIVVRHGTPLYRRYLCTARYLINNAAFPSYFMRRAGQYYLNTWHGTPLKTLGKDIVQPFMEHENGTRNFLHATHIISPNPHTTRVLRERYDLDGLYRGVLIETGYPRIDLTLNADEAERQALRQTLGIPPEQVVVLYAPTWRGDLGQVHFDVDRLVRDLGVLSTSGAIVLFRGHHLVTELVKGHGKEFRVVPNTVDTNELLSIVDVLVTDYSSIAIDFLATGRPVIHYLYDYAEYQQHRGLYFEPEELPGTVYYHIDDVLAFVKQWLWQGMDVYADTEPARQRFCPHDDGSATRRVVNFFLRGGVYSEQVERPRCRASLLYAGDFSSSAIMSTLNGYIKRAKERGYQPVVVIERDAVNAKPEWRQRLALLGDEVAVLGRCEAMPLTTDERAMLRSFEVEPKEVTAIYRKAYRREFYRLFGDIDFAEVINLEGRSPYWASLFAFGEGMTRVLRHDGSSSAIIKALLPYYTNHRKSK